MDPFYTVFILFILISIGYVLYFCNKEYCINGKSHKYKYNCSVAGMDCYVCQVCGKSFIDDC